MKAMFLAAAAALVAFGANAGEISLSAPMAGATLNGEVADMSVYYTTGENDSFHIVATYVTDEASEPAQLVMDLQEGDALRFSLPGAMGEIYGFARKDGVLSVSSAPSEFVADIAKQS